MIDHLDKQTQPMDLEPKRGRGRPATGQALSNAERQRLYRERQKSQRNGKNYEALDAALISALDRCDKLAAKLGRANEKIKELEAQLASRNKKPEETERAWTLQGRSGSGKWSNLACGMDREEASRQLDRVIDNKILGATKDRQYRIVEEIAQRNGK